MMLLVASLVCLFLSSVNSSFLPELKTVSNSSISRSEVTVKMKLVEDIVTANKGDNIVIIAHFVILLNSLRQIEKARST